MILDLPWWFEWAACRGRGTRAFVGARGGAVHVAKTICSTCEVTDICLWYAMSLEDPVNRSGVYGGASPPDRHRLANDRGITPEMAREWYVSEQIIKLDEIHARNQ